MEFLSKITEELSAGLLYTHIRINDNTKKTLESTSFLYALIELLNEKGLLSIEELDERKKQIAERLVRKFTESGMGLMYQASECDKYSFEHEARADCQGRLDICKANCCKLPFALSRQDVEERVVRWEFGRPYLIAHDTDGYCVHLDKETFHCSVHEHRPVPCRGFDCKDDKRWKVWADYNRKVLNPDLNEQINQSNQKAYTGKM
ncbi:MAG: YkgJ family cysteine cluster protein [Candidatus Brocadia sp.]|nr:YkgJ family cysteine cluster protein [Candidatus Brocadia sp.]